MRLEIRELKLPIVLTALMLAVATYWAWQTWSHVDDRGIGREQHEAERISDILVCALSAIDQGGQLGREGLEHRFGAVLAASPYQFFLLQRNGMNVVKVGRIPDVIPAFSGENAVFLRNSFVFFRQVSFPANPAHSYEQHSDENSSAGSGIINGEYLLVLGKDISKGHMPTDKFIEHVIVPFVAVLLLLVANAASWMMVLRNRSLFEQLEIERTRSAHLEDLGLAAAGLAHETKNPLGIISGIAQQVARDPQVPEKSRALLETIVDEIDKSVSHLGLFMTFARKRQIKALPLDAERLIEDVVRILEPELEATGIHLSLECSPLTIVADEEMLRQILVNLILNSLAASSMGGTICIRLQRHGSLALIEVADDGCGISRELLPDIFRPYVTGNPDGHGLGLSIVKRFTEDHGWSVSAQSQPGKGTVVRISGIVIAPRAGSST